MTFHADDPGCTHGAVGCPWKPRPGRYRGCFPAIAAEKHCALQDTGEHPKYGQTKEQPCLFTQPPPSQLEPPLSEGRSYREAPQAELPQAADPLLARGSEHLLAVYRSARVG